ncbi:phosphate ABC transporter permease subunit PstC [Desulfopila aestuarii]|uniref:Phosphate transport system permease protein n=1 Tax=Desulfopila aestuarii DSM 18488 TaxID=1121416 RepID=A0A1M7XZX1_9BACT|nr:phosphate ABC transporter permease subunit PstC [Desulfopila aestuarii]SHO44660.1 phosphate ABC transporter membrane protein 1, PhoT family [Desulfopila aestuarii DSM 18488]
MLYNYTLPCILILSAAAFLLGRSKAQAITRHSGLRSLHSLPTHYGVLTAMACAIPAMMVFAVWQMAESPVITSMIVKNLPEEVRQLGANEFTLILNDIHNFVEGNIVSDSVNPAIQAAAEHYAELQAGARNLVFNLITFTMLVTTGLVYFWIKAELRARNLVESVTMVFLIGCSVVAILTTIGIILSVLFEAIRFFKAVPLTDFLFGLDWSPQTAMRADQAGSSGAFGAVPVMVGTFLISFIAMMVAIPIGLLSAIYLAEYANSSVRTIAKPMLEILAGIPTVVYGFFAALSVAPLIRDIGQFAGLSVSSESALAAGLVMGIMIIPFISSISDDVIHAVPQALRDGSYGLGATKFETVKNVVIPAALPGIVAGVLLAVSRAIGETMIVVMAAGLSANLTFNPLKAVTTVTVQIVTLLVGDQEFDSPKTLAAFALGLLLFVFTLILNFIALRVVRKYREQYD